MNVIHVELIVMVYIAIVGLKYFLHISGNFVCIANAVKFFRFGPGKFQVYVYLKIFMLYAYYQLFTNILRVILFFISIESKVTIFENMLYFVYNSIIEKISLH